MSPPKAVKVLGMKFPIVVGGAEFDRALREMGDEGEHTRGEVLAGFCVRTRETAIYIRGGMDRAVEQDTVLHEVLHACYYAYGSPFGWMDTGSGGEADREMALEEAVVRVTTPVMLKVLRDNPKLVAYLTS